MVAPSKCVLEKLAEELEGTLHMIAHAGFSSDMKFINERLGYFRKKYKGIIDLDDWLYHGEKEEAIAYFKFIHLLDCKPKPEDIAQECHEILYDHLIPPILI